MTEEILQAAIMQLKSKATERFAIIKDLYHRPATTETVDTIVKHSLALAQLEGAMVTLQQYSSVLGKQTEDEEVSNAPQEEPTPVEVEEDESEDEQTITESDLESRSPSYRRAKENEKILKRSAKENES